MQIDKKNEGRVRIERLRSTKSFSNPAMLGPDDNGEDDQSSDGRWMPSMVTADGMVKAAARLVEATKTFEAPPR